MKIIELLKELEAAKNPTVKAPKEAPLKNRKVANIIVDITNLMKIENKDKFIGLCTEAANAGFDQGLFKQIITCCKNEYFKDNENLQMLAIRCCNLVINPTPIEDLLEEQNIAQLAQRYPYEEKGRSSIFDLLLLNPIPNLTKDLTEADPSGQVKGTTFVHQLFEQNANKDVIKKYFRELNSLAYLNKKFIKSYLNLADTTGKSITALLIEKSALPKYQNIYNEVKDENEILFPQTNNINNIPANEINTHTESIHSSVDKSFVKLAKEYYPDHDQKADTDTDRTITVNRDKAWNEKINDDIDKLKFKLEKILKDTNKNQEYLNKTAAALRLVEGMQRGEYWNVFYVSANKPVSCGLTPKEILAISYHSLDDINKWNNPQETDSHLENFIQYLYDAKRGYNIDAGKDNFNSSDLNRCTGGTINAFALAIRDHKLVEIKIITVETMEPGLVKKLPDILNQIITGAEGEENQALLSRWLITGVIDNNLKYKIIKALIADSDFSSEFNHDEIRKLGSAVLGKYNTQELTEQLQKTHPTLLKSQKVIDVKYLINGFVLDKDKGYIPYLESVYQKDPEQFEQIFVNLLKYTLIEGFEDSNDEREIMFMSNLLMSSQNKDFNNHVNELFKKHCQFISGRSKNFLFILAIDENCNKIFTSLLDLEKGLVNAVDPREGHYSRVALITAIYSLNNYAVKTLLANDVDVIAVDKLLDNHLLFTAASYGYIDIVRELIANGADVNAVDKHGVSLLLFAVRGRQLDIVRELITKGADVNAVNKDGNSPLFFAVTGRNLDRRNLDIVRELIANGADVNAVDKFYGVSPLFIAVRDGHLDIARELIAKGADANKANIREMMTSPFEFACRSGQTSMVKMLLAHGAYKGLIGTFIPFFMEYFPNGDFTSKEIEKYEKDPVQYIIEYHYDNPAMLKNIYDKFRNKMIFSQTTLVRIKLISSGKLSPAELLEKIEELKSVGYDLTEKRNILVDSDTSYETSDQEILYNYLTRIEFQGLIPEQEKLKQLILEKGAIPTSTPNTIFSGQEQKSRKFNFIECILFAIEQEPNKKEMANLENLLEIVVKNYLDKDWRFSQVDEKQRQIFEIAGKRSYNKLIAFMISMNLKNAKYPGEAKQKLDKMLSANSNFINRLDKDGKSILDYCQDLKVQKLLENQGALKGEQIKKFATRKISNFYYNYNIKNKKNNNRGGNGETPGNILKSPK